MPIRVLLWGTVMKQELGCGKTIVAVDSVPADALYASVLLAVIQQKAVAVYIVAADLFDEGVNLL